MKFMSGCVLFLWVLIVDGAITPANMYSHEKDANYWLDLGHDELQAILHTRQGGVAKNIILFLGDGMGVSTVTGGRIWAGQQKGLHGEEYKLSWDKFPFVGLSMTYNIDHQVTDSAASTTAILSGVKTNQGVLGQDARSVKGNCSRSVGTEVDTILDWALAAGKSVGLVTTARVTHATPAAAYAHTPDRDWEIDRYITESERKCKDIAYQLIKENSQIQVILGGGRTNFLPESSADPDPDPSYGEAYYRADGVNLIEEWKNDKAAKGLKYKFVYDKAGLDAVDPTNTDYILGLFNHRHMQYEAERNASKEPPIGEMTELAVKILQKNTNGFFLFVESGRIDHANHYNWAHKTFAEVDAMDRAVQLAKDITSEQETLIVVTADHSHVLSIAGYASRGNDILGLSRVNGELDLDQPLDNLPFTTLVYGNGPGYSEGPRPNLTDIDTTDADYTVMSAVPMVAETHAGEDVAIYATGPQSFLYTGTHEQSYIPLAMAYASCIGPYTKGKLPCAEHSPDPNYMNFDSNSAKVTDLSLCLFIATLLAVHFI